MDYLKRFVSFNILSIIGYWVLGLCIYNFIGILRCVINEIPIPGMALIIAAAIVCKNTVMSLIYFLSAFLCEFLISFISSKIFKKQVGLNFNNKIYDLLLRFGIFCCIIPITILIGFSLWMMLGVIFNYDYSWLSLIILCFGMFDIEIKDIFFRKYFRTKTK